MDNSALGELGTPHPLAIDLGSRFVGWAMFATRPGLDPVAWPVNAGTWTIENLKATKGRNGKGGRPADRPGARWNRLRGQLAAIRWASTDRVFYERTRRHEGQQAAVAYGGSLAILEAFCANCELDLFPVEVADVKRFALGRGAGKKEEVIAAIARAFPHLGELDEHGSDAVAIGGAGLTAAGWRIERS